MKKIIVIITMLFLITGCTSDKYVVTSKGKSQKSVKTYQNLTYEQFDKKIKNKDSFVLFMWQTGCSHCEAFEPTLNKTIKHYNLNVYGINLKEISESEYEKLKNKTYVTGTPTLVYIEKGSYLNNDNDKIVGNKSEEELIEFFKGIDYLKEK